MNTEILSNLGLPMGMVQDLMLLLLIMLVSFVFGMFIGKRRLVTVLINIYVSFSILMVVPKAYLTSYTMALIFFYVLLIVLTIFGDKLFEITISGSGSGFLGRVFAVSFFEVVLLVSITLSEIPKKEALAYVSKTAYGYLTDPNFQFLWMVAPLALLFLIHKRLGR